MRVEREREVERERDRENKTHQIQYLQVHQHQRKQLQMKKIRMKVWSLPQLVSGHQNLDKRWLAVRGKDLTRERSSGLSRRISWFWTSKSYEDMWGGGREGKRARQREIVRDGKEDRDRGRGEGQAYPLRALHHLLLLVEQNQILFK
jgi:hypothetical protein